MCDGTHALSESRHVDIVKMPDHEALLHPRNCKVTFPVTHSPVNGTHQYAFHVEVQEASIVPRQLLKWVVTRAKIPEHREFEFALSALAHLSLRLLLAFQLLPDH